MIYNKKGERKYYITIKKDKMSNRRDDGDYYHVDRSKNRSDRYQSLLLESCFSPDVLAEYADARSMYYREDPELHDELLDLKDELVKEFWRLIDTKLTERQKEVLHYYAQGYTQTEIAKKLNINQSSITKSIWGNCDYRGKKKIYGGAAKKLQRLVVQDEKIQAILKRLNEISAELSNY